MKDSQGCAYQRLFCIQNRSAADYAFAVVQHNGLAGGNGALGGGKIHPHAAIRQQGSGGRAFRLVVAGAGRAGQRLAHGGRRGDPVLLVCQ